MTLPDPGLHPGLPIEGIVFDLDGTLVDTAPDITSAVNRLLDTHGLPPQAVRFVEKYIGEGSFGLIDKLYKGLGLALEPARVTADVDTYLALYKRHPVEHSTVYADALGALPALHAAGRGRTETLRFAALLQRDRGRRCPPAEKARSAAFINDARTHERDAPARAIRWRYADRRRLCTRRAGALPHRQLGNGPRRGRGESEAAGLLRRTRCHLRRCECVALARNLMRI
jgi:hypothetical protein